MNLSEGTSPSSSFDEGSRSTPSNLPKVATRTRKKKTSDSEDEDYVAAEEEATSKRKVIKKEYGTAAATKPGMKQKVPAKRAPMSKARASTQETLGSAPKEQVVEEKIRNERVKKTTARVLGRYSIMKDSEEEEEEDDAAPAPKAQNLMGDAIRSGAAPSKPKDAPKDATPKPKSTPNTRSIPAAEKNKARVPEAADSAADGTSPDSR